MVEHQKDDSANDGGTCAVDAADVETRHAGAAEKVEQPADDDRAGDPEQNVDDGALARCSLADAINLPPACSLMAPVDRRAGLTELFDLASDSLDALVQAAPVFIEASYQLGCSRRNLVLSVFQYREQRVAEGARAGPDSDSLFDQKGADLVDRRRPAGHQPGPDAMTSLQVELILALLLDEP